MAAFLRFLRLRRFQFQVANTGEKSCEVETSFRPGLRWQRMTKTRDLEIGVGLKLTPPGRGASSSTCWWHLRAMCVTHINTWLPQRRSVRILPLAPSTRTKLFNAGSPQAYTRQHQASSALVLSGDVCIRPLAVFCWVFLPPAVCAFQLFYGSCFCKSKRGSFSTRDS